MNLSVFSAGGVVIVSSLAIADNLGSRSIFANSNMAFAGSPFSPIDFRFDRDITAATLLSGDGGSPDNDGDIVVKLYDANDNLVQVLSQFYGTSRNGVQFDITTTFRRAVVDTTNTTFNPHSVAAEFSSVTASPVPEPGSMVFALPALVVWRRRKTSNS